MEAKTWQDTALGIEEIRAILKEKGYDVPIIFGIFGKMIQEAQAEISFKAGREEVIKFLKKKTIPCYGGNRLILRTDWKELLK